MSQPEATATINMPQTATRNLNNAVVSEKIGINKIYLLSIRCYLRIALVVCKKSFILTLLLIYIIISYR
jgi:hypothetical protein